ncbi:response regulator receiver domain-containing protein [Litoreibacter ponti]|uniref:Response regulator receiver domain-containing protein n=1 Tax=Litoreibacter ponti TaxID=1510457 RepID=A0A2T6BD87_9RHOB|nr:response regulator [Litoreibacter ponti]PTX54033.1 response regulator receiver domain-containing protein [Litoreibacter ponti]
MTRHPVLADRTILLAEDEVLISRYLCRVLERAGACVTPVRRAADVEALAHMADRHFDVALLDVSLEDGSVLPAAELLIQRWVPIVFHSGHDQPVLTTGPTAWVRALDKPAPTPEIVDALAAQISLPDMQREIA